MLNLIKYDLKYNNIGISKTLLVGIATFIYAQVFYGLTITNYFCLFLFLFYSAQSFTILFYEKRSYFQKTLPVSNLQLALQRIFVNVIIFAVIFLLGFILHQFHISVSGKLTNSISELVLFGGLALLLVFSLMILADIYTFFTSKIILLIYLAVVYLSVPIMFGLLLIQVSKTYTSLTNYAVLFNIYLFIVDIVLMAISILTFIKRKNYLKF